MKPDCWNVLQSTREKNLYLKEGPNMRWILAILVLAGMPALSMGQDSFALLADLNASTFELEAAEIDYQAAKAQALPFAVARDQAEAKLDSVCVDKEKQIDALIAKANQPCPQYAQCGGGCYSGGGGGGGGMFGNLLMAGLMGAMNYYAPGSSIALSAIANSNSGGNIFNGGGGHHGHHGGHSVSFHPHGR
jgi:hypothetical protein